MEIRFVDWFAGIGGFRHGLEKANKARPTKAYLPYRRTCSNLRDPDGEASYTYDCVGACELDRYARQVYARNFGHEPEWGDSRAVDPTQLPDFDLFCAGFPCQSFSVAGKRRGFEDTRGTLFFEICRIVGAKRPRLLLLENVKGLLSHDEGDTFQTILRALDDLGYDCQWEVLNSKNFGVPQNRERVFIIGHLRGTPRPQVFPLGTPDEADATLDGRNEAVSPSLQARQWRGQGKQLDMLMIEHGCQPSEGANIGLELGSKHEPMPLVAMTECRTEEAKEIRKGYQQQGYDYVPRRAKELRPRNDGMANAVTANQGIEQLLSSPTRLRRLTPLECERLQGFPDGWTEGVSDTQRYKMLGNAVTVNVVEAIARAVKKGIH